MYHVQGISKCGGIGLLEYGEYIQDWNLHFISTILECQITNYIKEKVLFLDIMISNVSIGDRLQCLCILIYDYFVQAQKN